MCSSRVSPQAELHVYQAAQSDTAGAQYIHTQRLKNDECEA